MAIITMASAAPTIALSLTWAWILLLWFTGAAEGRVWEISLIVLACLSGLGALLFLASWIAILRLRPSELPYRWLAALGLLLSATAATAVLTSRTGVS